MSQTTDIEIEIGDTKVTATVTFESTQEELPTYDNPGMDAQISVYKVEAHTVERWTGLKFDRRSLDEGWWKILDQICYDQVINEDFIEAC